MRYKFSALYILILISLGCKHTPQVIIKSNDVRIHYMGRIAVDRESAELSWPGSSIKIAFTGTGVKAVMMDQWSENNYNVIVDDKVVSILHPTKESEEYTLVSGLSPGKHTLELFKRTEWSKGKTWFYQFEFPIGSKILPPPPAKKRKMEFFGDSITSGYDDEEPARDDNGSSQYENGYISYAAITARHFDADFHNISRSGIGITVGWIPMIMPEMYDRLDPTDPKSKWDFAKFTPDVVVINLFQNDSWLVKKPNSSTFKARFGSKPPTEDFIVNAYSNFVKTIRGKYPKANIICILGSMDAVKPGAPWAEYIEKAVAVLNDKKIQAHIIPYKNTEGHPDAKEQQAMANDLIIFIEKNIRW